MARQYDNQGTPFSENWNVWMQTIKDLLPNPLAQGVWKSTRVGDVLHKGSNIIIEAIRANPKATMFVIIALIVLVLGQTAKIG